MTVLLTGFQSYGGRSLNPAQRLAEALDGEQIADVRVAGRTLPVSYRLLPARLAELIEETGPRAVICLGLWPGEPVIRLERVAVNIADFEIADNEGTLEQGALADGARLAYASTLPIDAIQDRLIEAGIPVRLSGSAGTFLCNACMFHALRLCAERSPAPACGFIHIPYLPEQVSAIIADTRKEARLELHQRADLASMALDTMLAGLRLAIETTLTARL